MLLSRNKFTFPYLNNSFLFKGITTACITSKVFHNIGLEKYYTLTGRDGSFNPLKQRGTLLFHWFNVFFSDSINQKKQWGIFMSIFCHLLLVLPFSTKAFSGKALKNNQTCPYSNFFPMTG